MRSLARFTTALVLIGIFVSTDAVTADAMRDFGDCKASVAISDSPFKKREYKNSYGGIGCEGIYRATRFHEDGQKVIVSFAAQAFGGASQKVSWARPRGLPLYVREILRYSAPEDMAWFSRFGQYLPEPSRSILAQARYERNIIYYPGQAGGDFFDAPTVVKDDLLRERGSYAFLAFFKEWIGGEVRDVFVPAVAPESASHRYTIRIAFPAMTEKLDYLTISLSLIDTDGEVLRQVDRAIVFRPTVKESKLFDLNLPTLLGGLYRIDFLNVDTAPLLFYAGENFGKAEKNILSLLLDHRMRVTSEAVTLSYGSLERYVTGGDKYLYSEEDIKSFVAQSEARIYGAMGQSSLRGLRSYVEEQLYDIKSQLVLRIGSSESPFGIRKASTKTQEQRYMTPEQATSIFEKILGVILKSQEVSQPKRLTLDLKISTIPAGARFSIYPKSYRSAEKEVPTNSTITNLYRGLYLYSVQLDGYKSIDGVLDLIDQEGDSLTCRFSSQGSSPCKME